MDVDLFIEARTVSISEEVRLNGIAIVAIPPLFRGIGGEGDAGYVPTTMTGACCAIHLDEDNCGDHNCKDTYNESKGAHDGASQLGAFLGADSKKSNREALDSRYSAAKSIHEPSPARYDGQSKKR